MHDSWWRSAVVYQIYPRSFRDTTGNGVGDLQGVRRGLDHLAWLGVDAIWISPFFRSPMKDYGYDVADYCDVDPIFGALADFDQLVADAHSRGLRVVIDWVPNHSSDQHPWFIESRSSRSSPKRDWYVWRDGTPSRPPNNWRAAFSPDPAWTWDETTRAWYLHSFLAEQPDLNWANPQVESAMHDTLRFWLDRGVDGFRMDVVHLIGKDPALADVPEARRDVPYFALNDYEGTHALLRRIRATLDAYAGDRVSVGEIPLSTRRVATYYGQGDELHLNFNFPPLFADWTAKAWREQVERIETEFGPRAAWPTWVLSNHDQRRHRTRYGSEARARAAATLLLTLRGTPFLYAGEEFGLEDAVIPDERQLDPGGRDGCRAPIPWEAGAGHGWARADPWLPWPPDATQRNAVTQRDDPGSILHLYRALLRARRESPALQLGTWDVLPSPEGVLAYRRAQAEDERVVLVNFSDAPVDTPIEGNWTVEVSSNGAAAGPYPGTLGPTQAQILSPQKGTVLKP